MSASASAAAKSAKSGTVAAAATAGIALPASMAAASGSSATSDEENLMESGMAGARSAAGELNSEMSGLCPSLTYKQRIIGAASCAALGLIIDIFATLALFMGKAHAADYAVLYTVGNMTAICGSAFVVGPCRQVKVMCKPVRRVAATVYLGTMVATIFVAIYVGDLLLIFSMLLVQYCALIWYGASFIPFGRTCILKALKTAGGACKKALGLDDL